MIEVRLTPAQLIEADRLNERRAAEHLQHGAVGWWPPHWSDRKKTVNNMWSQRCEAAFIALMHSWGIAAVWQDQMGGPWLERRHDSEDILLPDGRHIDVKAVEKNDLSLQVADDRVRGPVGYVLVGYERHPVYEIIGMTWGWEVKQARLKNPYGKPYRQIKQGDPRLIDVEWEIVWRKGNAESMARDPRPPAPAVRQPDRR